MTFVDEDFIPESGAIFNYGEIGCEELISKVWIKNDPVKEMCCGDEFVILITTSGRAFSYGKNDWGQLGLGEVKMVTEPCCIKSLRTANEKAVHVACGRSHSLISSESHKLFAFGSNSDGQLGLEESIRSVAEPTEVTSWNAGPIKLLAAGGEFSAALTETGSLYMWGSNSDGQLGLNDTDNDEAWKPTKLQFFSSPVTSVCCGAYHIGAITGGTLYMWGEASDGKLGLGDAIQTNQYFPQKVHLNSTAKQLACGNNHSLCLTSSGEVYVWGLGESGQLGLGPQTPFMNSPTILKLPNRMVNAYGDNSGLMERFTKVSAGERHTALINANGLIFTFGDGRHGKLGNFDGSNSYCNRMWPTIIEKLSNDLWVEDVDCGGCHTVVLIRHRHVEEQLDDVKSSGLTSKIGVHSDTTKPDSEMSSTRRHRRKKTNDDSYDDRSLPVLKAYTVPVTNGASECQVQRKDSPMNIEEEITDVKFTSLKSAPSESTNCDITSSTADELEKMQTEMKKYLTNPDTPTKITNQRSSLDGEVDKGTMEHNDITSSNADELEKIGTEINKFEKKSDSPNNLPSRRGSLDDKVDKFSDMMDAVYGDSVVTHEDSAEVVRRRAKKKRKIVPIQSKLDPIKQIDQPVWNNDADSDKELADDRRLSKNSPNGRENSQVNPEVAKMGCQHGCSKNQESKTCSVI